MEQHDQQHPTRSIPGMTPAMGSPRSQSLHLFQRPAMLLFTCVIATLVIVGVDLLTEVGMAIGLLYLFIVWLAGRFPYDQAPVIAAGVSTVFVLMGFWLSPAGGDFWIMAANRGLSILGIWGAAMWMRQQSRNRQILESIVATSPIGKLVIDQEGKIVLLNKQIEEWFGYRQEELIGQPVETILPEHMKALLLSRPKEIFAKPFGQRMSTGQDFYGLHKHGGKVPVDIGWTAIDTPKGKMTLASLVDMSEQRKLKKAMAARIRQQTAIVDFGQRVLKNRDTVSLMQTAVEYTTNVLSMEYGMVLELQPAHQAFLLRAAIGWHEGVVGQDTVPADAESEAGFTLTSDCPVIVHDIRLETRFSYSALLRDHGVVSGVSCQIPGDEDRPFGTLGIYSAQSRTFSDDEVNFVQTMASILANAMQRNLAEDTIEESQRKYETLIAHLPDVVYSTWPDPTTTMFISQRVKEWTGIDPVAFSSNSETRINIIHPDDRDQALQTFQSAYANRGQYICDYRIIHKDSGAVRYVKDHAVPFLNEKAQLIRFDGIMSDITEQKETEHKLKHLTLNLEANVAERTREVRQSHETLRRLAAELTVIEHRERRRLATELHDYLAQLLIVCRMKLGQTNSVNTSPEVADLISSSDQMLEESLTYTRSLIAELSPQVLYQFGLPVALKWLGEQMEKYGLTVEVSVSDESMDFAEDVAILLYQTVRELLLNVAKHAGVPQAEVSLSRRTADQIEIIVKDRGKGFVVAKERNLKKFGLLSIRERIHALQGRFDLDSVPGKGTKATIVVPLQKHHEQPVVTPAILAPLQKKPLGPSEILRVLLVDDMAMVREGIRSLLQNYPNLQVVAEAVDGQEAIEFARRFYPDVIVMDISMPKLNGIEATRHILSEFPDIKVIGLSINDDNEQRTLMLQAGGVNYLKKDCAAETLYEAICAACPRE